MKLYKYDKFINESNEDIHSICKKYGIEKYTINEDGSIDVDGNVYLTSKHLNELPLKFRNVSGHFNCSNNELTSLEGSPKEIGGVFDCCHNQLTSLEGSPIKVVGGIFYCNSNKLTSLEGITQMRSGHIECHSNNLRDVKGIKEGWRGYLEIEYNPVYKIFKLFPHYRYDEVVEYLNEYDVIRDGKSISIQALGEIFYELKLFGDYEII
jgi:hypothetical protein